MKLIVPNCRLAFLSLWEPSAFNDGEPRHSAKLIIEPTSPIVATLDKAVEEVAKAKWSDKTEAILKVLRKDNRIAFVKDDYCNGMGVPYDGFQDRYYVSASSKVRPLVIDRDKTPLVPSDGRPYAGCYANVQVELWAQDNKYGKRINAELKGVQFVRDGDAFSGSAPASADDFESLAVEHDGADLV